MGRGDRCGVLMPCAYPVREVTAEFLRVHLWRLTCSPLSCHA